MAKDISLLIFLLVAISATAVATCPALSKPANGTMSGRCSGTITATETCTFICNTGFYPRGVKKLTCIGNTWDSSPPVCRLLLDFCPALEAPLNGEMFGSCKHVPILPGIPCLFKCDFGYFMKGPGMITCGIDFKWTSDPPTCVNSCPELTPGPKLKLVGKCKGAQAGDKCGFSCLPGYFLEGNAQVSCQADFEWDNETYPNCVQACPAVTQPSNGIMSGNCSGNLTTGDKCSFGCNEGSIMKGDKEIICQANKIWNKNPPVCVSGAAAIAPWFLTAVLVPSLVTTLTRF